MLMGEIFTNNIEMERALVNDIGQSVQKTKLAFLPVRCFCALGYGFLVSFVGRLVLAAGQLISSWFKCCLGQFILIKRLLILWLKIFVYVLEVFRSFDVLSSSQLHYILFLWTFEEVLDIKFRFYSRKNSVLGYLAACWQPKHPNQVGSLQFWRSVYSFSTSFFLGFIGGRRYFTFWKSPIFKITPLQRYATQCISVRKHPTDSKKPLASSQFMIGPSGENR